MRSIHFLACLGLVFSDIASAAAGKCSNDEDCSLNGICRESTKTCQCDPGWRSADCGELDLLPADRDYGYNQTAFGVSTWGSKIIHDPEYPKRFHLFLSEFANNCGLDYWSPYSRIIHVESYNGPTGPYTFVNEIVETFSHNPTVFYSPADELYLMYHIGCPYTPLDTCTASNFTCGPGNSLNGESGISVQSSPNLITWTPHGRILEGKDDNSTWDSTVTNPSAMPLYSADDETSEILLAYRGCDYNCYSGEYINLATAPNFKGPYTKMQDHPIFDYDVEDPFLWQDKRGHYHMLLHSLEPEGGFGDGPKVGRHAFARKFEGPWTYNNETLAFNTTVEFTDGTKVDYFRRERPQLFFSEDGEMTPLYLTNGVQEKGNPSTYSTIVPLRDAKKYEASLGLV